MIVEKIVIVPTAISPPYLSRERLNAIDTKHSVNTIEQGESPNAKHGRSSFISNLIYFFRTFKIVFFPHRKANTNTVDIACEIIVAKVAPPRFHAKPKHKNRIKNNIQNRTCYNNFHADNRKTLCHNKGNKPDSQFNKNRSVNVNLHIL